MSLHDPKRILMLPLPLLLAALVVLIARPQLETSRLTNLDVGTSEVPSVYLQMDPRLPGRCTVTDRQGSTRRRSDDPAARTLWSFERGGAASDTGNLPHWLLRSKKRGAFLLVPAFDTPDWAYPFFHELAREQGAQEGLAGLRWVRLYVNRIFHGLYLQTWLPDLGSADDGGGSLRPELLMVRGTHMGCADIRFVTPCRVYPELVALGRFPEEPLAPPLVDWLLALSPTDERVLLMEPDEPYGVAAVPMPVALQDEYRLLNGQPLPTLLDERFPRLLAGMGRAVDGAELLPPALQGSLPERWNAYRERFLEAARVHCEYHQCADELAAAIPDRLDFALRSPAIAAVLDR